jgi:hypothetical protein
VTKERAAEAAPRALVALTLQREAGQPEQPSARGTEGPAPGPRPRRVTIGETNSNSALSPMVPRLTSSPAAASNHCRSRSACRMNLAPVRVRNEAPIDAAEQEGVGDDPSQVARAAADWGAAIPIRSRRC